jgi:hypothetical protein
MPFNELDFVDLKTQGAILKIRNFNLLLSFEPHWAGSAKDPDPNPDRFHGSVNISCIELYLKWT